MSDDEGGRSRMMRVQGKEENLMLGLRSVSFFRGERRVRVMIWVRHSMVMALLRF